MPRWRSASARPTCASHDAWPASTAAHLARKCAPHPSIVTYSVAARRWRAPRRRWRLLWDGAAGRAGHGACPTQQGGWACGRDAAVRLQRGAGDQLWTRPAISAPGGVTAWVQLIHRAAALCLPGHHQNPSPTAARSSSNWLRHRPHLDKVEHLGRLFFAVHQRRDVDAAAVGVVMRRHLRAYQVWGLVW